jgi:DnaJ-like protein
MAEHELPLRFYNPSAFAFDTEVEMALLADMQIRRAIERGEFDDLPGAGKPLDLPDHHDPDWWLKSLVKREGLAMLPPSIQLRKDDAALDVQLDRLPNEAAVRREVGEFNERVMWARYQLPAGPPLITMPRDIEATVAAWSDRRAARAEGARQKADEEARMREEATMKERNRRGFFSKRTRRQPPHGPEPGPTSVQH